MDFKLGINYFGVNSRNCTYWRHRISRLMQIVAKKNVCFFVPPPEGEVGLTNKRP